MEKSNLLFPSSPRDAWGAGKSVLSLPSGGIAALSANAQVVGVEWITSQLGPQFILCDRFLAASGSSSGETLNGPKATGWGFLSPSFTPPPK